MNYNLKDQVAESKVPVKVLPPWYYNPLLKHIEQVSDGKGLQRIIEGLRSKADISRK